MMTAGFVISVGIILCIIMLVCSFTIFELEDWGPSAFVISVILIFAGVVANLVLFAVAGFGG